MSYEYAHQKIEHAIWRMARSSGTVQDRLYYALMSINPVQAVDFPTDELRAEWEAFYERVTSVADERDGSFRATTAQMSDEEAGEAIDMLTSILAGMQNYREDEMRAQRR